jgi:hypothetical protein
MQVFRKGELFLEPPELLTLVRHVDVSSVHAGEQSSDDTGRCQ